jgi:hypothetical protein
MTLELRTISSPSELAQYLQREAEKSSAAVGVYLRQLQDVKIQAEKDKKTKEVLQRLIGRKAQSDESLRGTEAKLDVIGVLVNPSPDQQQALLEELIESQQTKLSALDRVRKSIEPLLKENEVGVALSVITSNGVPVKLIFSTDPTTSIDYLAQGSSDDHLETPVRQVVKR